MKWLNRIQVIDHRYQGRFMARDYVTIRELEDPAGQVVWTITSVGPARLKSAPAKVTRVDGRYTIIGVAWGAPIQRVEVSIDGNPWTAATLPGRVPRVVALAATHGASGRSTGGCPHRDSTTLRRRAIDVDGNMQPAPEDPLVAARTTFWENNGQITRRVEIPPYPGR